MKRTKQRKRKDLAEEADVCAAVANFNFVKEMMNDFYLWLDYVIQ